MPDISRNKGNQTMKCGQLIECNRRNIFLEKSCAEHCGEISPRPFLKKSKLNKSLDQQFKVLYSLFILYVQVKDYQNILTELLVFSLKNKKRSGTSFPGLFFCMIFK